MKMTATKFRTAEDKEKALRMFKAFFQKGCPESGFTKFLYDYASNMYGHIAHYNRQGYYEEWFKTPAKIVEWLGRALMNPCFGDPSCTVSDVEMGLQDWIRGSGLRDKYEAKASADMEKAERAELVRLEAKYGSRTEP